MLDWLLQRMAGAADRAALASSGAVHEYGALVDRISAWSARLADAGIAGRVVAIEGDCSLDTVASFVAAAIARNIVVPISTASEPHRDEFLRLAEVEYHVRPDASGTIEATIEATGCIASHGLYERLRGSSSAGLVLFSSGTSGAHKAAVHDLVKLLEKFRVTRHTYRTLLFLQLDHIGGINTLFYTLANLGTIVTSDGRLPRNVCEAIE